MLLRRRPKVVTIMQEAHSKMTEMLDPFEIYVVDSEEDAEDFELGAACVIGDTECEACQ